MTKDTVNETNWTEVAAKAQAYQCLQLAGLNEKSVSVTDRAKFLGRFGLTLADSAALLGSSEDSLRHLLLAATRKEATAKVRPATATAKPAKAKNGI